LRSTAAGAAVPVVIARPPSAIRSAGRDRGSTPLATPPGLVLFDIARPGALENRTARFA
jgi:hypothetical protein